MICFLNFVYSTVYYVNSNVLPFDLQSITFEIYCINTNKKLNYSNKINVGFEKIKREINSLYESNIEKYKKINFIKNLDEFALRSQDPYLIITYEFYRNYNYKSISDLIAGGCKDKIMNIGPFYFCECNYKKCGVFCETDKNTILTLFLMFLCLLFLLFKKRKAREILINVQRKEKEKTS